MSFSWAAVDERQRQKQETERQLKDFLRRQQEEAKARKVQEKQNDLDEHRKLSTFLAQTASTNSNTIPPPQLTFSNQPATQNLTNSWPSGSNLASSNRPRLDAPIAPSAGPVGPRDALGGFPPTSLTSDASLQSSLLSNFSKSISMDDLKRAASLRPSATSLVQENQDELMMKLRFAEEQLQQERRSRGWLEAELNLGKTMLAQLTAKVDKMQETLAIDALSLRNVAKQVEETDRRGREVNQELSIRLERDQLKLHQTLADVVARQRHLEKGKEDEENKNRVLMEELNTLRYKIESYSLVASEVNNEFRARTKDWEFEQQRGVEAVRAIKGHDHALEMIQQSVQSKADAMDKKIDMSILEMRQRVDNETRGRATFEQTMRDMYHEVRKVLQSQERTLLDRIESTRQGFVQAAERERQDREKTVNSVVEQVRSLERAMKESEKTILDKVSAQVTAIETTVGEEKSVRAKFQTQLQSDVEEGFKLVHQGVSKKATELQDQATDLKHSLGLAVKSLQESIVLVEKAGDQKLNAVEDVLRVEIKSRMELDQRLDQALSVVNDNLDSMEKKIMDSVEELVEDCRSEDVRLDKDLQDAIEQLKQSKTRSVEDIDNQLGQIRKRIAESEGTIKEKFKSVGLEIDQLRQAQQEVVAESETRLREQLSELRLENEATQSKMREVELTSQQVKTEIEDKFNFKTMQMDQTLEAFKEELGQRVTIKDAEDTDNRIKGTINSLQTSITHLVQGLATTKDEIETRATKKDLDEAEARTKSAVAATMARLVQLSEELVATKEDVASKSAKKDVADVEDKLKALIVQLQTRDVELEDMVNIVKEELADRVFKKQMAETEQRLRSHLQTLEEKDLKLEKTLTDLTDTMATKATKQEMADVDKTFRTMITAIEAATGDMTGAIREEQADNFRATHDAFEAKLANIDAQLNTLQLKTNGLDNGIEQMKMKISDNDTAHRFKLQEQALSLDGKLADQRTLFEKMKESVQEDLKQMATRIEDVPRQFHNNDVQYGEFKRFVTETLQRESEKVLHWLTELRDNLQTKVTDQEFERLQSEVNGTLQKIGAQVEIDGMTCEQLRQRLQEVDVQMRERIREIRTQQERMVGEHAQVLTQWRETAHKRFEDIESRLTQYPKLIDQSIGEIKRIRYDIDDRINLELLKTEKELAHVKNEVQHRVSERHIDDTLTNALNPIITRIERLSSTIEEVRTSMEKRDAKAAANTNNSISNLNTSSLRPPIFPSNTPQKSYIPWDAGYDFQTSPQQQQQSSPNNTMFAPGSFYKPPHLVFGKGAEEGRSTDGSTNVPAETQRSTLPTIDSTAATTSLPTTVNSGDNAVSNKPAPIEGLPNISPVFSTLGRNRFTPPMSQTANLSVDQKPGAPPPPATSELQNQTSTRVGEPPMTGSIFGGLTFKSPSSSLLKEDNFKSAPDPNPAPTTSTTTPAPAAWGSRTNIATSAADPLLLNHTVPKSTTNTRPPSLSNVSTKLDPFTTVQRLSPPHSAGSPPEIQPHEQPARPYPSLASTSLPPRPPASTGSASSIFKTMREGSAQGSGTNVKQTQSAGSRASLRSNATSQSQRMQGSKSKSNSSELFEKLADMATKADLSQTLWYRFDPTIRCNNNDVKTLLQYVSGLSENDEGESGSEGGGFSGSGGKSDDQIHEGEGLGGNENFGGGNENLSDSSDEENNDEDEERVLAAFSEAIGGHAEDLYHAYLAVKASDRVFPYLEGIAGYQPIWAQEGADVAPAEI
ncbi:hypothetical protein HK102_011456 [Quaeritorhiza haematococci]|nr:hypothetical protein HK102_011456 [Quaeritorhiza haematococci]